MAVPPARVALISPHDVVVAGLTSLLDRHRSRVELVRSEAVEADPDVVLYDVAGLAGGDRTVFDRLVNHSTSVVIAMGRDHRPDLLNDALAQGADGCLLLSIREEELLAALDAATTRRRLGGTGAGSVMCACPSARRAPRLGISAGLNDRESDTLSLIARGLSNEDIADRHRLSVNTVKTNVRSAYAKIGVHSRSQAVLWIMRHGFDTADSRESGRHRHS
ncbi:hypothetical protein ASC77_12295 [Nocardioides sp. Root1257]|uniref:LuxR C-terminal-related transcriptional regulator n=1 Tax=unclassified Nocardioides TaxID=2615069 RepID=UPI0006FBC85C|nr:MULTISPECIES: response regulator transcription factor [unclassified Nocardioides]KQW47260.1 hypothetical protein ASC77_12295 [Nocardioides sp. Root1257]KRC45416.1 hypothetical protein ASE24_12300 [Nocardioides sp. Root224]